MRGWGWDGKRPEVLWRPSLPLSLSLSHTSFSVIEVDGEFDDGMSSWVWCPVHTGTMDFFVQILQLPVCIHDSPRYLSGTCNAFYLPIS